MIALVEKSGAWKRPIVTTLEELTRFWVAEDYHQDYLQKKPDGYTCHFIRPIKSFFGGKVKRSFPENAADDEMAEHPKTQPWKRYLRFLKWYGIGVVVVTIILVSIGYTGAGWEGG